MATDKTPVQLIQELYAAFGRGDVPCILDACSDDVVWTQVGHATIVVAGCVRCWVAGPQQVDTSRHAASALSCGWRWRAEPAAYPGHGREEA